MGGPLVLDGDVVLVHPSKLCHAPMVDPHDDHAGTGQATTRLAPHSAEGRTRRRTRRICLFAINRGSGLDRGSQGVMPSSKVGSR